MTEVTPNGRRNWPFEILPLEELTGDLKKEIYFLESAYREGFEPYQDWWGFGAQNAKCTIDLVRRYRKRSTMGIFERVWELRLVDLPPNGIYEQGYRHPLAGFVIGFEPAYTAALKLLRGEAVVSVLRALKPDLDLERGYHIDGVKLHE